MKRGVFMKNYYDDQKGIQILKRILSSKKATREKKLLAMIGLVSMATKGKIKEI